MIRFLFWNINRKPLNRVIASLVVEHQVDILILAECDIVPRILLDAINRFCEYKFFLSERVHCQKIQIFSRIQFLSVLNEGSRWTIQRIGLPEDDILLAATHLPSKLYAGPIDQLMSCIELMDAIRETEISSGHARTIAVGDFNANPFESGMINAKGLHAVMSQQIARRINRTVDGQPYDFFYNPMWGLMGDDSPGPPGTYYYDSPKYDAMYWNTFDQVLIRPGLLDRFDNKALRVLTEWEEGSLLSCQGLPDHVEYSDHLPLFFRVL